MLVDAVRTMLPQALVIAALSLPAIVFPAMDLSAAKICKPSIQTAFEPWPDKKSAEFRARQVWHVQATQKYGLAYGNWDNAANRKMECRKQTTPLGVNGVACSAKGQPCILQ